MTDNLIGSAKAGLKSLFTVDKYGIESLEEDLIRIALIRNYIEESLVFAYETFHNANTDEYFSVLKNYALEQKRPK